MREKRREKKREHQNLIFTTLVKLETTLICTYHALNIPNKNMLNTNHENILCWYKLSSNFITQRNIVQCSLKSITYLKCLSQLINVDTISLNIMFQI